MVNQLKRKKNILPHVTYQAAVAHLILSIRILIVAIVAQPQIKVNKELVGIMLKISARLVVTTLGLEKVAQT